MTSSLCGWTKSDEMWLWLVTLWGVLRGVFVVRYLQILARHCGLTSTVKIGIGRGQAVSVTAILIFSIDILPPLEFVSVVLRFAIHSGRIHSWGARSRGGACDFFSF